MSKRDAALRMVVAVGLSLSLLLLARPGWLDAGCTATSLALLGRWGNQMTNYDLVEKVVASNKTDWPITMVFTDNASIEVVKDAYWLQPGSRMHMKVVSSTYSGFDTDGGTKTVSPWKVAYHMRLYAPPDEDRFYEIEYGYYVVGTTHIDQKELSTRQKFGWAEVAEKYMRDHASTVPDWTVEAQPWRFYNAEQYRVEGKNYCHNDDEATWVRIGPLVQ